MNAEAGNYILGSLNEEEIQMLRHGRRWQGCKRCSGPWKRLYKSPLHNLLFQTCQEVKSRALVVPSPEVDLCLNRVLFLPLHSDLSSCQATSPPPPPPDIPEASGYRGIPSLGWNSSSSCWAKHAPAWMIPPTVKSTRLPGTHQEVEDFCIVIECLDSLLVAVKEVCCT